MASVFCPGYAHADCRECECICHSAAARVRASRRTSVELDDAAAFERAAAALRRRYVPTHASEPNQWAIENTSKLGYVERTVTLAVLLSEASQLRQRDREAML